MSGGEFLINTNTTNSQFFPKVTALTNGDFVVVWIDLSGTLGDASGESVKAQRYDADGVPQGSEFLVNSSTENDQTEPSIAGLADGGFVVVWRDESDDFGSTSIKAQRYDADGVSQGGEFLVSAGAWGVSEPSIAALPDGGFVVAWDDDSADIRALRYDANGVRQDGEFLVNTNTFSNQQRSSVAALANGGFVVAWDDSSGTLGDTTQSIKAQRFDASSVPQGGEFLVNTITAGTQWFSSIAALGDGGFVVTWHDSGTQYDTELRIKAQRYDVNGVPQGDEFLVNTNTVDGQGLLGAPSVAGLTDGGFAVAWMDESSGGDAKAQRYNASGVAQGNEFLVNTNTAIGQTNPSITALADGGFVVVWQDRSGTSGDGSGSSVKGQRYDANGNPLDAPLQGTAGDDVLDLSGPGGGQAFGGEGNDIFLVDDPEDMPIELAGEGIDTVQASLTWALGDNLENLTLVGQESIDGTGNELENVLEGNEASNILDGQTGADTMEGGLGSDTYYVDDENDEVVETSSAVVLNRFSGGVARRRSGEPFFDIGEQDVADDIDQVISTVSFTLSEFVENLTLDGEGDIDGWGNGLDNTVVGNSGDNVLYSGEGGTDLLIGGEGEDTFVVDNSTGTTRIEDPEGGTDVLEIRGFLITSDVLELSFEETAGSTLLIHNSSSGVVEVPGFFGADTNPIRYIDAGHGQVDVRGAANPTALAGLLGESEPVSLLIDGEPYYQSRVMTADGDMIEAEQAQTFRQYLGGLGREPANATGLSFWLNKAGDGSRENMKLMARGFINTEEFIVKADADGNSNITDEEFVEHMFFNVFDRAPAEGGKNFWLNAIDRSEQAVAFMDMLQSPEFVLHHAVTVSDWSFWDEIA